MRAAFARPTDAAGNYIKTETDDPKPKEATTMSNPTEVITLTAAHKALLAKYGIAEEHGHKAVELINRARARRLGDEFKAPPGVAAMTSKVGDEVVTLSADEQELLLRYGLSAESGMKAKELTARYRRVNRGA